MHAGMFSRALKCLHDRVRIRSRARKKHLDNGAWCLTAHFQQTQLKRFERAGNTSENARLRYMNGMLLNAMVRDDHLQNLLLVRNRAKVEHQRRTAVPRGTV